MSLAELTTNCGWRSQRKSLWTEPRTDRLKTMWADGMSASQIAAALGCGFSRSAIIGKVHRLGLAGRVERKPRLTIIRRTKPRAEKITLRRKSETAPAPVAEVIHIAPDPSCKVHFLEAGKRQCRYPLWGEGYTPLMEKFYCGAVTAKEQVYCGFHHNITHYRMAE